jgi:RNA polymerase sigma-70 factor, ECF subfamily
MANPWTKLTDALLAKRIEQGNPEAFSAAYDRYAPMILRHLSYRAPDKETAEDLLSKTFLKCWEYVKSGKKITYLKQFLYTTAQNALTDHYRRKSTADLPTEDMTTYDRPDERDRATVLMDKDFDKVALAEALSKIRPEFRDVLIMRFLDELEINEVAKALNTTPNAVYVRVHRALKSLKEVLIEKP